MTPALKGSGVILKGKDKRSSK